MSGKGLKAGPVAADRLKSFVERIEKLIEERKAINGDIKDVFSEAKGVGYDVRTMRKLIQVKAMDAADRAEAECLLDTYAHAIGMDTYAGAREPTEEELEERAGRILQEVDRCMALAVNGKPPKIEAIKELIGCSAGKAHKLRTFVAERLSSKIGFHRENENPAQTPSIPQHTGNDPVPVEGGAPNPVRDGEASADERDASASSSPPESCGDGESRPVPCGAPSKRSDAPPAAAIGEAGVAPGPQDTPAEPQTLYQRITGAFAEPRKLPVTDEAAADAMEAAHEHLESLKRSKGVSP